MKTIKITALTSLAGRYLLPYSKGHSFEIEKEQGLEIIASGDAELYDEKSAKHDTVKTNDPDKEAAAAELKVNGAETVKTAETATDKDASKAEKA